jgi:hypothetical protein
MSTLSLDTTLAMVGVIIGLGMTLAMDAKTKGEFRFAVGCFVFSGLMLTCTIGVWDVTTEASLPKRALISILLLAIVLFGSLEAIRWTRGRHERSLMANRTLPGQDEQAPDTRYGALFKPIEVSVNCYRENLPIAVPAGEIARIVGLNEAISKTRSRVSFYQVPNTTGDTPLLWPDMQRIAEAKQKYGSHEMFAWRCEVINHGQDNVLELSIPFQVFYNSDSSKLYPMIVLLNPIGRGKAVFYFVNDCPVKVQIQIPDTGTAKLAGEQSIREFQFEQETPNQGFQLGPSNGNWTQTTCE